MKRLFARLLFFFRREKVADEFAEKVEQMSAPVGPLRPLREEDIRRTFGSQRQYSWGDRRYHR
jgi:hypothetical protein